MADDSCPMCDEVRGRVIPPGGVIFDAGHWIVAHHPGGFTDPGELIVKARRHCESMAELTAAEAAALGPVLQAAVAAIERVVRPPRVYVASYGERVRHLHFLLLPRTQRLPAGHVFSDVYRRGRSLLRQWGLARNPSPADRATVAAQLREQDGWTRLST